MFEIRPEEPLRLKTTQARELWHQAMQNSVFPDFLKQAGVVLYHLGGLLNPANDQCSYWRARNDLDEDLHDIS